MAEESALSAESSAVQAHLGMMQGVIERMASNSRSCKVWCVTLVAAVLVLIARTGEPQHALLAVVPTTLFLLLDMYYLALERAFSASYHNFVEELNHQGAAPQNLYAISPAGSVPGRFLSSLSSFSIWPFYVVMVATTLLAWLVIL